MCEGNRNQSYILTLRTYFKAKTQKSEKNENFKNATNKYRKMNTPSTEEV